RLGASVLAPPPAAAGTRIRVQAQLFSAGDLLPFGVEALPGREPPYDVLLWVESPRAVAIGDTLIDRGDGIELLVSPPRGEPDESPANRVHRKSPVSRAFSVAGL